MQEMVVKNEIAGAVTMVVTRDKILHLETIGFADVAAKKPMTPDTLFWIASMTKPITGTAILMLQDEAKLSVSDPVAKYLPEFAGLKTPSGKPANLTIRQLLTHTSGLGEASGPAAQQARTLADLVPIWLAAPMQYEPGEKWKYTQSGINAAARIVEVVSGMSFDVFLQKGLFDPLGMKDTTWALTPAQEQRLVGLYAAKNGSVAHTAALLPPTLYPSGGAGLCSTVPDYLRFVQMLAGNGTLDRVRVLSSASVEEMRRKQLPAGFPGLPPGNAAGLLMRYVDDPTAAKSPLPAGAYGWSGAYGTHFWIDPTTGLAAVWMINLTTAGGAGSPDALEFEQMVTRACQADSRCGTR